MKKLFNRSELDMALFREGLTGTIAAGRIWIIRREKMGKLVCPRDPVTNQRKFTGEQIDEIVKAFSIGGKGEWKYERR